MCSHAVTFAKRILLLLRELQRGHHKISEWISGPLNPRIHACRAYRWFDLLVHVLSFLDKRNVGSATSVISNPVWVIQTAQTVRGMDANTSESVPPSPEKRLGVFATAARLLQSGGPAVFFRGLGPALVLVVNPVIQYTAFEQLKNALVRRRHKTGRVSPLLTDWDFFMLGAISKLGELFSLNQQSDAAV